MNIFISYASEQRAVAEEIALALRGEGHQAFFDRSELHEGDAYNSRLRDAIDHCDLLVFLISPESVSTGRYTLTELKFAEEKWRSPAGRVLPIMVRPTDAAAIPAYLRAVVILRPAGNTSAEVVAAVGRLARPRWLRFIRRFAGALSAIALIGVGFGTWHVVENRRTCAQALGSVHEARLHEGAGDYAAAWDRYTNGLATCPGSHEAAEGQERLAMDWLQNIRATEGKETFTDIVNRVQPALSRAAVARDDRRAADALAHLGWADFLRSREGQQGLDPPLYYLRALQRDPVNPYAHAFWGHYILVRSGDLQGAKVHFDQAMASSAQRPLVRKIEIAALLWQRSSDRQDELVRVANEMRLQGEVLPASGGETHVRPIWNVYYDRLVLGEDKEDFLGVLLAKDHLLTFQWLFPAYENSSNRVLYRFMLAQLQERSGERSDALANYQSLLTSGVEYDRRIVDGARQGVQRLQGR